MNGRAALGLFLASGFALGASGCRSCSHGDAGGGEAPIASISVPADASPMTAIPAPAESVAKLLNPDKLPAYSGPTGSVEGTIFVTGPAAADNPMNFSRCPDAVAFYGKTFREGTPKTAGDPRPLADAVVAVTGYSGYYVREGAEAKLVTIEGCTFSARTVTMTFGQRLEVLNKSKDFWTPMLEPGRNDIMMMAPPFGGDPVKIYPKKPGHYHLVDRDRKYAVADLYAFLHPLHAASAADGSYRIDGVPAGRMTVNAFHPATHSDASREVEITAGRITRVDLTLENRPRPAADPEAGAAIRPADSHP